MTTPLPPVSSTARPWLWPGRYLLYFPDRTLLLWGWRKRGQWRLRLTNTRERRLRRMFVWPTRIADYRLIEKLANRLACASIERRAAQVDHEFHRDIKAALAAEEAAQTELREAWQAIWRSWR